MSNSPSAFAGADNGLILAQEIEAYESRRADLECRYLGKFAVFYHSEFVDVFDDFDTAAKQAIARFGNKPFLVRQIGAEPISRAASVSHITHR